MNMGALEDLLAASSGMIAISGMGNVPGSYPQLVQAGYQPTLADMLRQSQLATAGGFSHVGADMPADANALQQAMAQRMVHSGLVVTQQRPTRARQYPLGFESAPVNPGATAVITSRPQVPFRGERLTVPSDIAGSFTILDLRVGKNSQFTSAGAVPARGFQENATEIRLQMDTAQISQDITISVQNIGGAPQTFRAMLVGSAVE
jgi:hypothetical protein